MLTRRRFDDDAGYTLVELLVTMMVLLVLGTFTVSAVTQGMRSTSRAQDRVAGMADVQLAMERVTRELRAADPLTSAAADSVAMQVSRDGQIVALTYTVAGRQLTEQRTVAGVTTSTVLADEVDGFTLTYLDPDDTTLATPVGAAALGAIVRVRVHIERFIPRANAPIELETTVHLRNAA